MTVLKKSYTLPEICEKDVARYALADELDGGILAGCLSEIKNAYSGQVCYAHLDVEIKNGVCDFGFFKAESQDLARALAGCRRVILFVATAGVEYDRLIVKYSRLSPLKALIFQAVGSERVESVCDLFCRDMGLSRPRFSAGYGDLPLEVQKDVFTLLAPEKYIGVNLNSSLLMTPTKSVSAFIGEEI